MFAKCNLRLAYGCDWKTNCSRNADRLGTYAGLSIFWGDRRAYLRNANTEQPEAPCLRSASTSFAILATEPHLPFADNTMDSPIFIQLH